MNQSEFASRLQQLQINFTSQASDAFYRYYELLAEWNEKMNLTAITALEDVYDKHFYDCVLPAIRLSLTKGKLCDVGAGAGFPSIPMKILFPELEVTIVEPLQKRCVFLQELVHQLDLQQVQIVNARAEEFAQEHRESFDVVSARAVANLQMLSELCIPLVKVNGIFLAMKGSSGQEEAKQAAKATALLGCKLEHIDEEKVGDHTHVNLVYRKITKTPSQYPRMFAKIKKNPL